MTLPPAPADARGEQSRLIAWNRELKAAHERLRRALRVARESLDAGDTAAARRDLLLYCKGFCAALDGHHTAEDAALFPELYERHPSLRPILTKLTQDHELIAALLVEFEKAITAAAPPAALSAHLDGIAAIMESHFAYEERQLLTTLANLNLPAEPHTLLGPL
ncbi:hemerythrin domain-containing protein [Actinocorallia sp. A-T 12471]|uniref:hemerythrin domain-containing protein n=1 Tax=Actinocorallia sp. A-T 12471 TaxID=3089813 RepID=UPI0029CF213C|nr:hemerythrin domain-containing protein [Actinocorallia sp. A-T 12471]MDX6744224.1 hemerythrin domain-containing protein [Actinocorallia sp. A-T 12471]